MSEPLFRLRAWDTSLPDAFSLEQYISGAVDMAVNLTGAYTADGHGLAHEVLTAAEFLILFGVLAAPPVYLQTLQARRPTCVISSEAMTGMLCRRSLWRCYAAHSSRAYQKEYFA